MNQSKCKFIIKICFNTDSELGKKKWVNSSQSINSFHKSIFLIFLTKPWPCKVAAPHKKSSSFIIIELFYRHFSIPLRPGEENTCISFLSVQGYLNNNVIAIACLRGIRRLLAWRASSFFWCSLLSSCVISPVLEAVLEAESLIHK